jgi:hypothetical protein
MIGSYNKTKEIWQIINKETGSSRHDDYLTSLKMAVRKHPTHRKWQIC